ncbi:hypothetical protein LRS13_15905 [Svornostia abyssi]|uniref:Uncharacterized protein n=1 Tax=Svornostia abyssi TaxID=2898438 RepID=A0ABY5PC00_9ACTN|nr:hypothetical protein LRS13_15905 [Parviterribacteraceae bacterium J379]
MDGLRSNIELATWTRRLLFDVAAYAPASVALPLLPADASGAAFVVREGAELLFGLRWKDHEPRPVAFSIRFAAAWCGVSFRAARLAIGEMLGADVIVDAGSAGRVPLFLPGRTLAVPTSLARLKEDPA